MGRGDRAMDRPASPTMLAPGSGPFFEASTLRLYGLHPSHHLRRTIYKRMHTKESGLVTKSSTPARPPIFTHFVPTEVRVGA
jgi:hypothetical protein